MVPAKHYAVLGLLSGALIYLGFIAKGPAAFFRLPYRYVEVLNPET
jgi:hypothetical protein